MPQYCFEDYVQCEAVQGFLDNQFGAWNPTTSRDNKLFVNFLLSPENRRDMTIQNIIDNGAGRTFTAKLVYMQRFLESQTDTAACDQCVTGPDAGTNFATYEIGCDGTSDTRGLKLNELERVCQTDEFYYVNIINRLIDVIVRKIDSISIFQARSLMGLFRDGSTVKQTRTKTSTAANASFVNNAVEDINFEIRIEGEIPDSIPLVVVGTDLIYKYAQASEFGCCSNTQAIDWGAYWSAYNMIGVWDRKVEGGGGGLSGFGDNHFFVTVPGALQLITFNRNRGSQWRSTIGNTLAKGTITDPLTGLVLDYRVTVTCSGGDDVVNIWMGVSHELIGMPADVYCNFDDLKGATGAWEWEVANA